MQVEQLDHLVLTVENIDASVDFYTSVLGMKKLIFGQGRIALSFGNQKINLHQKHKEFEPKAKHPKPGSADLCFIIKQPIEQAIAHLKHCKVPVLEGPVSRTGATGEITSVYFRDPDGNLIEVSVYPDRYQ